MDISARRFRGAPRVFVEHFVEFLSCCNYMHLRNLGFIGLRGGSRLLESVKGGLLEEPSGASTSDDFHDEMSKRSPQEFAAREAGDFLDVDHRIVLSPLQADGGGCYFGRLGLSHYTSSSTKL